MSATFLPANHILLYSAHGCFSLNNSSVASGCSKAFSGTIGMSRARLLLAYPGRSQRARRSPTTRCSALWTPTALGSSTKLHGICTQSLGLIPATSRRVRGGSGAVVGLSFRPGECWRIDFVCAKTLFSRLSPQPVVCATGIPPRVFYEFTRHLYPVITRPAAHG